MDTNVYDLPYFGKCIIRQIVQERNREASKYRQFLEEVDFVGL